MRMYRRMCCHHRAEGTEARCPTPASSGNETFQQPPGSRADLQNLHSTSVTDMTDKPYGHVF